MQFNRVASATCIVAAVCCLSLRARADVPTTTYQLTPMGLTGSEYEYTINGGLNRLSAQLFSNAAGDVAGETFRYQNIAGGKDAWVFHDGQTKLIGFTGAGYEYVKSPGVVYRNCDPVSLNASGVTVGSTSRLNSTGVSRGLDAFYFDGTTHQLGRVGAGFEYTASDGLTFRVTEPWGVNDSGRMIGISARFATNGDSLGNSAWIFDGSTYADIGLTGASYSFVKAGNVTVSSPFVRRLNNSGAVLGGNGRYTSAGVARGDDWWVYNNGTYTQANLTGGAYEFTPGGTGIVQRQSTGTALNDAGDAMGFSRRFTSTGTQIGQDAWVVHNGATHLAGLTDPEYSFTQTGGVYRNGSPKLLNATGQVAGTSERVLHGPTGSRGNDTWRYSDGTTTLISPVGADYNILDSSTGETKRASSPSAINSAGQVVGWATRANSAGSGTRGIDAWQYSNGQTRIINLTGAGYEYKVGSTMTRVADVAAENEAGQAIGYSQRFDSAGNLLGYAGWIYDDDTNATTPLIFDMSDSGFSSTFPSKIGEDGSVLGVYSTYDGNTNTGSHAFWWRADAGMRDLGDLVAGGQLASQWANVYSLSGAGATNGSAMPSFVIGGGLTTGQTDGGSLFMLTAIPEPASIVMIPLVFAALMCSRATRK